MIQLANLHRWPTPLGRGGFGKLPSQADFVRAGPNLPELNVFDRWIEAGLSLCERELGPGWIPMYDERLFHRFVFRPQDGRHTIAGIIAAAMDRHDRRYPFVSYSTFATELLDGSPLFLPGISDSLFRDLEAVLLDAAAAPNLGEIQRRLSNQPDTAYQPAATLEARYSNFLEEVTCGEMSGPGGESGEVLLSNLVTVLASRSVTPEALPVALALPLNQPQSARALEVRFWLELVIILLHWYPSKLSYFWDPTRSKNPQGSLIISTRQPSSQLWLGLLGDTSIQNRVWRPWLDEPFSASAQSYRIHVNLHAQHSLKDLLDFLCPGYPQICPWYAGQERL